LIAQYAMRHPEQLDEWKVLDVIFEQLQVVQGLRELRSKHNTAMKNF
jgi:hypothetical protein